MDLQEQLDAANKRLHEQQEIISQRAQLTDIEHLQMHRESNEKHWQENERHWQEDKRYWRTTNLLAALALAVMFISPIIVELIKRL